MRPDNAVCLDRFKVEQGQRQECVLSPLFNIFFVAVLNIVLQRFSEDTVILAELVPLKKPPTSLAPAPVKGYVRSVVCGMLYADGACIVRRRGSLR